MGRFEAQQTKLRVATNALPQSQGMSVLRGPGVGASDRPEGGRLAEPSPVPGDRTGSADAGSLHGVEDAASDRLGDASGGCWTGCRGAWRVSVCWRVGHRQPVHENGATPGGRLLLLSPSDPIRSIRGGCPRCDRSPCFCFSPQRAEEAIPRPRRRGLRLRPGAEPPPPHSLFSRPSPAVSAMRPKRTVSGFGPTGRGDREKCFLSGSTGWKTTMCRLGASHPHTPDSGSASQAQTVSAPARGRGAATTLRISS